MSDENENIASFWCIWAVMKIRARHPAASVRDVHLDFTRVI
jgi:hypothetical protein